MRTTIVATVPTVRTGRRFDRSAVSVEQNVLKRGPEDLVPHIVFRRSEIKCCRRQLGEFLLVSDARVEEGNRSGESLFDGRARVDQGPNVAQPVVLSVVVAKSVAQNRNQRNPVVVFSRLDAGEPRMNSDQLSPARNVDPLQPEYLRKC